MAQRFGAKIELAAPGSGLYLVQGRTEMPAGLIRQLGGQVVLQIPGSRMILAVLTGEAFLSLWANRQITHIGPVSPDPSRFPPQFSPDGRDG